MSLSMLVVWFAAASFAGWLFESLYNIAVRGHWEKRGFLFGPMCPIYGVGVVAAIVLFDRPQVADGTFPVWAVFLCSMAGSAVLEYVVSYVLEKWFGAVWWDYSNLPLNLNGRICLPASLLFGAAGTAVTYLILPQLHMLSQVVPSWAFELVALAVVFLVGSDMTATVFNLSDLMDKLVRLDADVNQKADDRLQQRVEALKELPERVSQTPQTLHALPARLREGGDKAVTLLRDGGAEVASKLEAGKATVVDKAQSLAAARRGLASDTARQLTRRQVFLLGQLRKFSSSGARSAAESLREAVRDSLSHKDE